MAEQRPGLTLVQGREALASSAQGKGDNERFPRGHNPEPRRMNGGFSITQGTLTTDGVDWIFDTSSPPPDGYLTVSGADIVVDDGAVSGLAARFVGFQIKAFS